MTKKLLSTVAIILSLNLTACTTFDLRSDQSPSAARAISDQNAKLEAPASWVFGTETDQEIAADWSSILTDPLLKSYIDIALASNPSLQASAEAVARSEALLRQARSSLVPSLGASLGVNGGGALEGDEFSTGYSAGLDASWEADLWGGIGAGVLASGYDLESTRATFEGARQALIAAVARAYILNIEAELLVSLTEQTLLAQEETLRIVNIRYELGAASRREVVLAQSDTASARDDVVVAQSNQLDTAMGLQVLLGQYPNGDIDVAPEFPSMTTGYLTGTPAEVLRRRPDVIGAELDVLSAFQATRATRADKWPSLSLSGGLDNNSGNLGDLLDPASVAYSLGARLVAALFDGGLNNARIDAASAVQRQTIGSYGQSVLDAYLDIETALKNIKIIGQRDEYVSLSAESASETLRLAEVQYKEGAIDLLDVLTFRQRSFAAERTKIGLQRQAIEARIALYLALGGAGFEVSN